MVQSLNEVNIARRAAAIKLLEIDFGGKRAKYAEVDGEPADKPKSAKKKHAA